MNKIYSTALLYFFAIMLILNGCKKNEETINLTTGQQFINYTINGIPYSFTDAGDSLLTVSNNIALTLRLYGNRIPDNGNSITFIFDRIAMSPGTYQHLMGFSVNQIPVNATLNAPVFVAITEVGLTGEFIAGNFTGSYTGPSPTNTLYNISCNFRVKRNY